MRLSFPRKNASFEAFFRGQYPVVVISVVRYTVMVYTFTLIFGLVFATTHVLAEWLRLYWLYPWLDMPMHIMGGVVVMLMLASLRLMGTPVRHLSRVWIVVLLTLVLLLWEAFGIYRFGGLKPDFWSDTALDLLCGIVGIVAGYLLTLALERIDALVAK